MPSTTNAALALCAAMLVCLVLNATGIPVQSSHETETSAETARAELQLDSSSDWESLINTLVHEVKTLRHVKEKMMPLDSPVDGSPHYTLPTPKATCADLIKPCHQKVFRGSVEACQMKVLRGLVEYEALLQNVDHPDSSLLHLIQSNVGTLIHILRRKMKDPDSAPAPPPAAPPRETAWHREVVAVVILRDLADFLVDGKRVLRRAELCHRRFITGSASAV